jgi:hypothetical protein
MLVVGYDPEGRSENVSMADGSLLVLVQMW